MRGMTYMSDEHEGTLRQAGSGWSYVECACYWKSARTLNTEAAWQHHEGHKSVEAQTKAFRQQIGTDG